MYGIAVLYNQKQEIKTKETDDMEMEQFKKIEAGKYESENFRIYFCERKMGSLREYEPAHWVLSSKMNGKVKENIFMTCFRTLKEAKEEANKIMKKYEGKE